MGRLESLLSFYLRKVGWRKCKTKGPYQDCWAHPKTGCYHTISKAILLQIRLETREVKHEKASLT